MKTLRLAVKGEYFDAVRAGVKPFEYRKYNDYWIKRLEGKVFDRFVLTKGYPSNDDKEKIIEGEYRGYEVQYITHPHFGDNEVKVFAIHTSGLTEEPEQWK